MQGSRILIVEADGAARDALVTCFRFTGADAHGAENVAGALRWLAAGVADVIIFSDESGRILLGESCSPAADVPLLVMLARDDAADVSTADAVLRRPIAARSVVERVEKLVQERGADTGSLQLDDLRLDVARREISRGEQAITLGRIEARVLAFFMQNPDRVHSRAQLLRRFWSSDVRVEERTVDVYAGRIRRALGHLGCDGYLQTVRGSGYRFSDIA
jgi:two-component system phosphate regulon response regulator PhoB